MLQTERADWIFVIPATLFFFLMLLVTLWDFIIIQSMIYLFNIFNLVGLGLFSSGIIIRIIARRTLGRYFSHGLRTLQKPELITKGIYKRIRHPAYLGSFLLSSAIPMIFSSLYGFLLALCILPFFIYRMNIEEKMLIKTFGDKYLEYIKKTKKIIPFFY